MGVNTALHFGHRISVLVRCVSFGGMEYPHFGQSVFSDARTFALSILSDHPKPATDYHLKTGQRE